MKIWIFNHYAVTPDMPGGTRHYDFAKELTKKGHQVTIFASSFHYSLHRELKLTKNEKWKAEKVDGVNFVWIKTFPYQRNDWRRVLDMISYMYRAYLVGRAIVKRIKDIEKPDIIIGSSVHLLAVLTAYWLSKYYKAKFIIEVRDLWPQTLVDMGRFNKNNLIIKTLSTLEKFLYQKARKIITLLPLAKNYIISRGINENKIVWIPNGVNLINFRSIKKIRQNEQFKVVYLGAHGLANALNVVLEAAKIIQSKNYKDIKFIFIGDGAEKKNLIKYSEELNLHNTEFRPPVDKERIFTVLNEADVLIFNIKKSDVFKYGVSSNKLFDYLAAARPVIFSVNAVNNPVEEAGCGTSIPPENPEMMAQAIIKLYQMSSEKREKMGQRGREYVEKYHNISVLAEKLEKVIQEVSNEK